MGMVVSIDGAGRIVLPKKVREQLGLRAGSQLELATRGGALELRPVDAVPALVQESGLWIHQGTAQAPLKDAVRRSRDERLDALERRSRG